MDNLALRYLQGTNESEAQHRLDRFLLAGDPQIFPSSGSSTHFSRLNEHRGSSTIGLLRTVRRTHAHLRVEEL
jgi:hypothetical protein